MRNIIVLSLLLIVFYLTGCDLDNKRDNTIYNNSSFSVTFSLRGTDIYTVQTGESIIVRSEDRAVVDFFESCTPRRVRYIQTGDRSGEFVDLAPIPVVIYNPFSFSVILSANGYLEAEPFTVQHEYNNTSIFTNKPRFTVTGSNFPLITGFQIIDDVMYVVVR